MIYVNYTAVNETKELAQEKIDLVNQILQKHTCVHHGFLGGSLGLLYYYYHASKVLQNNTLLANAEKLLAQVFEDINSTCNGLAGAAFSNGAAGFAYTVNYLQQQGFIEFDVENEFADLDKYLFNAAKELIQKNDIDYLHGAMGILHYFTSRTPNDALVKEYVNILATEICQHAIADSAGIWFKNFSLERLKDEDIADLGLAHGLSGILLILMKAWPFMYDKKPLEQTVKAGIKFILASELPIDDDDEYSVFATNINTKTNVLQRINRLAWCYGDCNIVLLLYRAGKLFPNGYYTEKGDEIGRKLIERKTAETTLCTETHFCHGTAGLAQFFLSLYLEMGHRHYYEAYIYWIKETLQLIDKEIENNAYATNPLGLLEGWAGVALVLSEYIYYREPMQWDKAFLL